MFAKHRDCCKAQGCLQSTGMFAVQGCLQHTGMFAERRDICISQGCLQLTGTFAAHRDVCSTGGCLQHMRMFAAHREFCSTQGLLQHAGTLATHGDAQSHLAGATHTRSSSSVLPCLSFPFPRARGFVGPCEALRQLGWWLRVQRLEGGQGERRGPAAHQMR